jgi:hypothetical protein
MKTSIFKRAVAMIAIVFTALMAAVVPGISLAQTVNYAPQIAGVMVIPFHVSGQYTATTTGVVRFQLPFRARVLSVQANARASGGTSPTLTVDVLNNATSILTAPVAITAGTVAFAAIATPILPDEATVNVNFAIGGTSPTWNDITVMLTVLRVQ